MTKRFLTIVLVAGVALLASATQARCEEKKDQQDASKSAQSTTDDQQKSSTDTSNASNNNQSNQSSNPAVPAPSNSNSDTDRNRDQSASRANDDSRDNDRSNQNQARTQNRSNDNRDNQARSDQRDNRSNDRDRNSNERDVKSGIQVGRASNRGVAIDRVNRGTIFYESGLRDGDVIISYHGRRIRSRDDFDRFVVYERGGRIPVVVWRNGREQTIYVTYRDDATRERSYISSDRNRGAYFGAEFDPQITDAVIVVRVDEGSPADRAGLRRDDVVLSLNGKKVTSGKEANDLIASMKAGDRLEVEYSRHARTEAVLTGGRDREVATRTSEDTSRDSTIENRDSDSRPYSSNRDSNYRNRGSSDQSQGRGIFGRRR
jgi:C-terminal processing protease CtpA/Prc